ncbi:MAG: cytochrome bd ubiquinol oxidase subunit [Microbacteriaceae bacterium]|jgi:cytochrome d ubiquinol oxidase subunit II|nr:cytochrome bd ubiquinol oxidase subunit [Microbacteriaceae bacterium]
MMQTIWFLVVLLCLTMYVALDGFDLGIGIGSLFERSRKARIESVELVATVWDGNESWLILLAVALWGGFPLAFGAILPDLFLPLIVTLFALILRGASIEFISQSRNPGGVWLWIFGGSSFVAAFAQGFALGNLTSPVHIVNGAYTGTAFGAFSWYSVLMGITVALGYTALGYGYIKMKTEGDLRLRAAARGSVVALVAIVFGILSLIGINATALPLNLSTPGRAIAFSALLVFALAGAVMAAITFGRKRTTRNADVLPFAGLVLMTVAVIFAFTIARYPVLVPPGLTLTTAQGPRETLVFLLVGIGLNIPLILFYTWFAHRTFGGKRIHPHTGSAHLEAAIVGSSK